MELPKWAGYKVSYNSYNTHVLPFSLAVNKWRHEEAFWLVEVDTLRARECKVGWLGEPQESQKKGYCPACQIRRPDFNAIGSNSFWTHMLTAQQRALKTVIYFFVISFKKMWRYLLALVFQVTNLMANHPGSFQFIIQECQGWRGALALSLLGRSVNPSIPTRVGGGFFPPFTNGTPIFFQLRQLLLNAK